MQCETIKSPRSHLVGGWFVLDVVVAEHVFERHLGDVVLFLVRHVLAVRFLQPLLQDNK